MDPIIGGALGAIARFAPEVLAHLDRKARRKHELDLLTAGAKTEQIRSDGEFRTAGVGALSAAITAQGQHSGVKWVDALNQMIRPLITIQWVLLLYPSALVLQWVAIFQSYGSNLVAAVEATRQVFGPEEKAICSFILNFWFLGRVLDKAKAA